MSRLAGYLLQVQTRVGAFVLVGVADDEGGIRVGGEGEVLGRGAYEKITVYGREAGTPFFVILNEGGDLNSAFAPTRRAVRDRYPQCRTSLSLVSRRSQARIPNLSCSQHYGLESPQITVGEASFLQSDLAALEIKLDGEDVKPFTKISSAAIEPPCCSRISGKRSTHSAISGHLPIRTFWPIS